MPGLDIVDTTEIANRLGVLVGTVHQWRQRPLGFPPPTVVLSVGPVWEWPVVLEWAEQTGRRMVVPHHHHR